jgi:hypothetical protein
MRSRIRILACTALAFASLARASDATDAEARARYFDQLLQISKTNPLDREIGKKIAGVRNVKSVLSGVLYRGGGPGGMVPIGSSGLRALCEAGFGKAIYLYTEGFSGARTVSCTGPNGEPNAIRYETADYLSEKRAILSDVRSRIMDATKGPVLVHCWNGYHASGEIAAVALIQFCGYAAADAKSYWMRNQVGARMISRVSRFREMPDLRVSSALETAICPR